MSRKGEMDVAARVGYCPHGLSYGRGCRCDNCRAVACQYMRNWRRRKAEKSWGAQLLTDRVSPEQSEKAIWSARQDLGLTFAEIGRACGISKQSVEDIYYQRRKWVTRRTEESVLAAYGPEAVLQRVFDPRQRIPWDDHKWKIYGLMAQGWTSKNLAQILAADGRSAGWVQHLSDRTYVYHSTLEHVDWLVELIGDRRGPSRGNPSRIKKLGYFPLIHYTEDGELIRESLTKEQRAGRVRSKHGKPSSSRHGPGPRTGRGGGH